jgi:hypothetical protein
MDNPFVSRVKLVSSTDYVKPLGIMITSHGRFVTTKLNREISEEVEIEIPPTTIYSFSADGESCAYPLDSMMQLAHKMKRADYGERITNESFLENVNQTQIDTLGYTYTDERWSYVFSRKPSFTGNVVKDRTTYFEKMFTTADKDKGNEKYPEYKSGVYVFYKEDGMIHDFYPIDYDSFKLQIGYPLLSDILNYFKINFGINRFYIFDATCSVVSVPGQAPEHYADTREKRHVANTVHKKKGAGRGKRKKTRRPKRKLRNLQK